ncbi:hypothetical protein HNO82_17975 [Herbaspirillum sp. C9C3]|nr:hypothetical protein [Herbaspirillum sp. C9C3]
MRLLADQNTSAQTSSNQSKSGSVGFSIGTDGFLVNANASGMVAGGDEVRLQIDQKFSVEAELCHQYC